MRRILVTGGAGFIGSNYVHYNKKHRNDFILVLDSLTYAGVLDNIKEYLNDDNFVFIKGDINNRDLVLHIFKTYNIDTIINFAASSHVDRSIEDPSSFIQSNVVGTYNLLECYKDYYLDKKRELAHFHHISTDEVYGALKDGDAPFTELHQYKPNSPYSASKAASDHFVRSYVKTYGIKASISNCSNNYGPYQYPEKLIPICIINYLYARPIRIYGSGLQIRDWVHVDDHVRAIDLIIDNYKGFDCFNIGGDNEVRNIDLVLKIGKILEDLFLDKKYKDLYKESIFSKGISYKDNIIYVEDRKGHDFRYAMCSDKAKNILAYKPLINFDDGLMNTIKWYLSHKDIWYPLVFKN